MSNPAQISNAEAVAKAVLYEGYILYPYRPSAIKNQQRWNFGVVSPAGSTEGAPIMKTQCLAMTGSDDAELDVKVRFLHLTARMVRELEAPVDDFADGEEPVSQPVEKAECGCRSYQSWQEGAEEEITLAGLRIDDLVTHPVHREFKLPANRTVERVRDSRGRIALLIVRERHAMSGAVEIFAEHVQEGLVRITVSLENRTLHQGDKHDRDGELLRSLVSAHKILRARSGEFVSLIDPPASYADVAEHCQNVGTFPVLAGEDGGRDVMLSSPIILYDHPQVAPESAGDLCDGAEIDEILSLRILTLTDEEKREMRESDELGRRILERTESLPEEQWLKLHGVLRGLRPMSEVDK